MADRSALRSPIITSLARNLALLAVYWLVGFCLIQAGQRLSDGWILAKSGELLAGVIALLLARRFWAVVGMYFAAVFTTYSAAGLLIHSIFGIRAAQGAPVHLAVFAAAAAGVLLGNFVVPYRRTAAVS